MKDELSTEELMLLENLMYLPEGYDIVEMGSKCKTVGQWLDNVDTKLDYDYLGAAAAEAEKNSQLLGGASAASETIVPRARFDAMGILLEASKYSPKPLETTGQPRAEWDDILNAVKNDETLMNLRIVETHVDNSENGGGGGVSALFVNPETNEAIVAFRGTASDEWKDNFVGGGPTDQPDGVSTAQQANALEWYQSLNLEGYSQRTVVGHSKGGNKAKYITVMDDYVDRCIAMDGQGFSDEFIETYSEQILSKQHKISNHNCSDDYVNILLNDIGEKTYYEPQNIGDGTGFSKILEAHCPNQYFKFGEDGSFATAVAEQSWETKELDQFLNSYLRSITGEERAVALAVVGTFMEELFSGNRDPSIYIDLLIDGENPAAAAYLIAYLVKYEQECPELGDAIHSICSRYGVEQIGAVDLVLDLNDGIDPLKKIGVKVGTDELVGFAGCAVDIVDFVIDAADCLPSWLKAGIKAWLKKNGLLDGTELSAAELHRLLSIITLIKTDLSVIMVEKNGYDRAAERAHRVDLRNPYEIGAAWRGVYGTPAQFSINCTVIEGICDDMAGRISKFDSVIGNLYGAANRLLSQESEPLRSVGRTVGEIALSVEGDKKNAEKLLAALRHIVEMYRSCEMRVTWG